MGSRIPRLAIFMLRALADQDHFDRVWDAMHWEWGGRTGERIIAARARGEFEPRGEERGDVPEEPQR